MLWNNNYSAEKCMKRIIHSYRQQHFLNVCWCQLVSLENWTGRANNETGGTRLNKISHILLVSFIRKRNAFSTP